MPVEPTVAQSAKARAIEQWTADPAGASLAERTALGSPAFYREVERTRYELYPWLTAYLTREIWGGKRTLEVGVGLGTDHLMLDRAAAELTGVDLTDASVRHTQRRFENEARSARVQVADAEDLPFGDDTFDAVYSFGVLHHTPAMDQAVREVHRVLRRGGTAVIGLYNRHSYFHAWRLLRHVATGKWRTSGLEAMRAGFEHGDGTPLVILSSKRELRALFKDFGTVQIEARHLPTNRLPRRARRRVDAILRPLERRIGWYWMVVAVK